MSMLEEQPVMPEVVRVPAAESMDVETFCLHMSKRHADSLGGMPRLRPEHMTPYVEKLYRLFHSRIHDGTLIPGREFDHEHRETRNA